ncbi:MAG TPA: type III-B CRISPR module-associated Cmr3 family protein, partial [Agitococcus sp.]|nr:type III-B CRISPR module-associated Cmr3 family protein [Agitococcus sp.]
FNTITPSSLPTIQVKDKRIKLLLTSPAIFGKGSQLPSLEDKQDGRIYFKGGSAKVVAASIPRHHVISGWDLANWQPKPAERVVPTGAVYWLDDVQYNGTSLQTALQDLLLCHLDPQRKAEGYNACLIANWTNP